jgi:hypothetical protein
LLYELRRKDKSFPLNNKGNEAINNNLKDFINLIFDNLAKIQIFFLFLQSEKFLK